MNIALSLVTLSLSVIAVTSSTLALRLGRDANQISIFVGHLQLYREVDFMKHELRVWNELPSYDAALPLSEIPEPMYDYVQEVGQYYQSLAYLSKNGIVDRDVISQQVQYRAIRTWEALLPHVSAERALRGSKHTFFNSFESFVSDLKQVTPDELDERVAKRNKRFRLW